ncbi:hypothetical protein GQ55_2G444900 [Panicum hallii var. hallii]|uniref:Uncharacterized protein n=1 Tax=Panicum hallii var. hallii TaxID=1504633 RepID=A0A2T7EZ11_9POAL|nr:hypothetical protein GQ55_2G444900 [Panicum hallii var. hallii]
MLMEEDIDDKFYQFPDHPALLNAQQPYAQILLSDESATNSNSNSSFRRDRCQLHPHPTPPHPPNPPGPTTQSSSPSCSAPRPTPTRYSEDLKNTIGKILGVAGVTLSNPRLMLPAVIFGLSDHFQNNISISEVYCGSWWGLDAWVA